MEPPSLRRPSPFAKVVTLWIPRRFLTSSGVDLSHFVVDVNDKIVRRGLVLSDGQLLTTPITDGIDEGILQPDFIQLDGHPLTKPIRTGNYTAVIYEGEADNAAFNVPARRDWQAPQREFFGLDNPYQMADDGQEYSWSHVTTCVLEAYLSPAERIAALIHGAKDRYFLLPVPSG